MRCARCQQENPAQARFCMGCGTALAARCVTCGVDLPPEARFCFSCGAGVGPAGAVASRSPASYTPQHLAEKILTSKSALEGERKQVTVLFADLKGSMELLADRDPEEARNLLDPVLERMMEAVHRYEGTVNQVMGDGIMALFGAPVAHEDHAVRACYAALRMQRQVTVHADEIRQQGGTPVEIRVGLNSGEVVVRAIGSDLRMDYTAVGQTTHLAARMEQLARPGTIALTPATVALADVFVEVRPLGPAPVKGLAVPVEVFELTGASPVRSRLHAAAARGLTRFVGRAAEVARLEQALARAGEGCGQVVAVVGEPGVGKSRLVWEVTHSHRRQGWLVLEAASVSYGKATTYFPVIELLRRYFEIEPRGDARKMREKVTGKLLSLDRALEPALPVILSLLDVPVENPEWTKLDPAHRRRQTLDALKRLVLRESQGQPVLLVVEDLHWVDSETQAWLDLLVESVPAARLLLLVTYRPEYEHGWGSKASYQHVRLDTLPTPGARELVSALLGPGPGLEELERLLLERTQGNPLFLEESVRMLAETGALTGERGAYRLARPIRSLRLPATTQAILAARIDRLAPGDKRLLQAAAVVGTDVPFALLEAVAEEREERLRQGLARLQAGEFLYEARLFPELEYTFKHALTHEVAYGGLLQERRRVLHGRIVDAIERLHAARVGEHAERLAHHAVRGELRDRAAHYLRQAGLKAFTRSALPDARAWFEQALGVLDALPASAATREQGFEIRLELRPVLSQLGEVRQAVDRLREAEVLADQLDDDRRRGRVGAFGANLKAQLGELDEAIATGRRALEVAERLGDLGLRILTTNYLGQACYLRGEYERVVELAAGNLAALPADWVHESFGIAAPASVYARFWLVLGLAQLGRFDEAAELGAEVLRIAEPTQRAFSVGLALWASSTVHLLRGDWTKARTVLERWIGGLATDVAIQRVTAVSSSAWVLAQLGEREEALSRLRDGEQLLDRIAAQGFLYQRGWDHVSLGRASLLVGRFDDARRLADRAIDASPSHPGFAAHARHLQGDVASHPDRIDAGCAEASYHQALALAGPRGMRPLVAHCHLGLARLFRRTGDATQAAEHLATAMTMYREMGMTYWLHQAEALTAT